MSASSERQLADEIVVRERIAAYLEHLGRVDIGKVSLNGLFTADEMPAVIASWIRNRLDEKWEAEVLQQTRRMCDGE